MSGRGTAAAGLGEGHGNRETGWAKVSRRGGPGGAGQGRDGLVHGHGGKRGGCSCRNHRFLLWIFQVASVSALTTIVPAARSF
ncbi:hypothetical protein PCLA_01f0356 [Pseudomonas citronellolis]|nr:hypothetical protein PCLA_01f0356 [Pseudomonas citronellolis]